MLRFQCGSLHVVAIYCHLGAINYCNVHNYCLFIHFFDLLTHLQSVDVCSFNISKVSVILSNSQQGATLLVVVQKSVGERLSAPSLYDKCVSSLTIFISWLTEH